MPPLSGRGFILSPEAHARPELLAATEEEDDDDVDDGRSTACNDMTHDLIRIDKSRRTTGTCCLKLHWH